MNKEKLKNLKDSVVTTAQSFDKHLWDLRDRNTQEWREASKRFDQSQEKRSSSLTASGILMGGTIVTSLATLAIPASAPVFLAAAPAVGVAVSAAAGLAYLGIDASPGSNR